VIGDHISCRYENITRWTSDTFFTTTDICHPSYHLVEWLNRAFGWHKFQEVVCNREGFFGNCRRQDRIILQAASCRHPNAAARHRCQVRLCGICGGQSGALTGFLRELRVSVQILIPPTSPHSSSSIIQGWYSRPNSGRRTKRTQSPQVN
jgi:hypothetical protein